MIWVPEPQFNVSSRTVLSVQELFCESKNSFVSPRTTQKTLCYIVLELLSQGQPYCSNGTDIGTDIAVAKIHQYHKVGQYLSNISL